MKNNLLVIFLGLILLSCQNKEINQNIIFHSDGNDMADIKLIISTNHTFKMDMEILPELEEENGKSSFVKANGTWTKQGDYFHLLFKTKGVILNALFEPDDNEKEILKIINPTTIAISEKAPYYYHLGYTL